MNPELANYEQKKQRLTKELRQMPAPRLRLAKDTSNLFRDRTVKGKQPLDVRAFQDVLLVDAHQRLVIAEGMTPYAELTRACLPHGVMPAVVPQLKSITIGGAVAGVGIESSSFRFGLVHETVRELEVLLANGEVVLCTARNEHADLFHGLPNSYGTLGYALRASVTAVPVKPYVRLRHRRYNDADSYFDALRHYCSDSVDFVDGVVFAPSEYYLTIGEFCDEAPYTSDYTFDRIYYRSIRERDVDFLTVEDYLWRWDTDWFWCSKNLGAQNPLIRRLLGRKRLNSIFYTKLMRWNSRWQITRVLDRLRGLHSESVIQDVDIPLSRCADFLSFYLEVIGFLPLWICPIGVSAGAARFPLYPMAPGALYVNFGFWDAIREPVRREPGYYNRRIERKVRELGGIKSLYSDSYFTPEEFWQAYDQQAYESLKDRYDPTRRLGDLYAKCVQHG